MSTKTFPATHLQLLALGSNDRFGRTAYDHQGVDLEPVHLEVKVDIRVDTVAICQPRA
jgi:hypothetical protein